MSYVATLARRRGTDKDADIVSQKQIKSVPSLPQDPDREAARIKARLEIEDAARRLARDILTPIPKEFLDRDLPENGGAESNS